MPPPAAARFMDLIMNGGTLYPSVICLIFQEVCLQGTGRKHTLDTSPKG